MKVGQQRALPCLGQWETRGPLGSATGSGDQNMMKAYLDNFGGQSITVSGLPTNFTDSGYYVYAYFNVDQVAQMGFTVADNAGNTDTRFGRQSGGNGTNYPLGGGTNGYVVSADSVNNFATATPSNAIFLQGFNGSSFTLTGVNGIGAPGSGNRARINGLQIIAIPEPSSVLALLFGSVGLLFVRRRR